MKYKLNQKIYFICPVTQNRIRETYVSKITKKAFYVGEFNSKEDLNTTKYFTSHKKAYDMLKLIKRLEKIAS